MLQFQNFSLKSIRGYSVDSHLQKKLILKSELELEITNHKLAAEKLFSRYEEAAFSESFWGTSLIPWLMASTFHIGFLISSFFKDYKYDTYAIFYTSHAFLFYKFYLSFRSNRAFGNARSLFLEQKQNFGPEKLRNLETKLFNVNLQIRLFSKESTLGNREDLVELKSTILFKINEILDYRKCISNINDLQQTPLNNPNLLKCLLIEKALFEDIMSLGDSCLFMLQLERSLEILHQPEKLDFLSYCYFCFDEIVNFFEQRF